MRLSPTALTARLVELLWIARGNIYVAEEDSRQPQIIKYVKVR